MSDPPGMLDDPRLESALISEERLRTRVEELATEIATAYADCDCLHMLSVLTGAFVFVSDLGRELRRAGGPPATYSFMKARTYDDHLEAAVTTPDAVEVELIPQDLAGRDVLIVEDILDQGLTLSRIQSILLDEKGVRSVAVCVLLDKILETPTAETVRRRNSLKIDFVGFRIPDLWVVGYGLDAGGEFRDLPCIAVLRKEHYRPA